VLAARAVDGLQVIDIDATTNRIAAITSFRDPAVALSCGFPATLEAEPRSIG
jgi:hypothetical protein